MSNVNTLITGLLPDPHTDTIANLTWWTKAELIQWADEALKRAATKYGVFIARDVSQTTTAGTATYNRPSRHLATLHISIANVPLIASSIAELEALDDSFETTQGTPARWYQDKLAAAKFGAQPVPNTSAQTIRQLYTEFPTELDIAESNTTIPGPLCFGDYIQTAMRAEANSKESDAALPEVSRHDREMMSLYEELFDYYWGSNQ